MDKSSAHIQDQEKAFEIFSSKALKSLEEALPNSPKYHKVERALDDLSLPGHKPPVYKKVFALLREKTNGRPSEHVASLAGNMRSINLDLVESLLADQDLYNLKKPELTIVLSKSAQYGGDCHREDIVSKHAIPEHLPNSEHRSSVYSSVIQYGNDSNRKSVLEKATPENFAEQDLSTLYSAISQYGNDADRDAVFPLVKALPEDIHRCMVLCSIVQHGNDGQRDTALSLATSEHMPDEWARSRVLCAGAKHGTDAQRDIVAIRAEQLSNIPYYSNVLCMLALHGNDAQRESVRNRATEQKIPDSAIRNQVLNTANRAPFVKSSSRGTPYDFTQYSRSDRSSSHTTPQSSLNSPQR